MLVVALGPIGYRLAASLAAEEERELTEKAEASAVSALAEEEGDYDENEEMILVSFLTLPSYFLFLLLSAIKCKIYVFLSALFLLVDFGILCIRWSLL